MTTIKAKSKKAAPNIFSKISNKISTRGALFVVEATRQTILEAFPLPNNYKKLFLVTTEATSLTLASFLPIKIPLKKHTWVSPSVVSIPTKSPKVFNNRFVNKLKQSFVSAIVTLNFFVVSNEILDKIFIVLSSMSSKMNQNQPLAVLLNVISSGRFLLVLEAKQLSLVVSSVFENWADQIETESSSLLVSGAAIGVAFILMPNATFKIKLAHIKAVFQLVHGFLDAKSVSKDILKLFCVEFASQVSLEAAFLIELTSFVHLITLKIAKSLVVSEFGSLSAAVVLHNMSLGVFAANIKTAFSVFGVVTCVVLKPVSIWQYVVIHFENLVAVISALNHWSVLVNKNSVQIFLFVNQQKTIVFYNKFKAKLVNFSPDCTVFEISDMSSDSGHFFYFVLVIFGSQADLDLAVVKTNHLAVDYKVASLPFSRTLKMFKPYFISFLFYVKASASSILSEFSSLVTFASPVAVVNSLISFWLVDLEFELAKLSVLVNSIVKPIGFMIKVFEQFVNSNLVSSAALGLRVKEVLVHMSFFSKAVGKLEQKVVALKFECSFEDVNISGLYVSLLSFNNDMFSNLMSLWEHKSAAVKADAFKTAKWLVGLVNNSAILFEIIQKMSFLGKFSSGASI
ncbi:hypothetical protein G9A89_010441 [Geosiphon pyriformis]|nr:hypothetical protein G9A89_010441 [Geosiphon pyriformis]